jgi:hypothetical protein
MMQQFGLAPGPVVAGLAVSRDGSVLYAANFENDSVSVIDTTTRQVVRHEVFAAARVAAAACRQPRDGLDCAVQGTQPV